MSVRTAFNSCHWLSPANLWTSADHASCLHPGAAIKNSNTICLIFHVRREALHIPDEATAFDGLHLRELLLGALRSISAHMALAAFRTHQFARARQAKSFGCRLMSLELEFARFGFTRHCNLLLSDKIKSGILTFSRRRKHLADLLFRFSPDFC